LSTTLLTRITGISLHMQWPLTLQYRNIIVKTLISAVLPYFWRKKLMFLFFFCANFESKTPRYIFSAKLS
jgi:hypothetical protein